MALIQWPGNLELGIPEIDKQHRKLVELLNELDAAMSQGRGKDAIGKVLDGLIDYTRFHFSAEERLMEQSKYPGSLRHQQEHVAFVKKLVELVHRYRTGEKTLSVPVMTFLSDWLRNHIQGTDKQYVPHVTVSSTGA